MEFGIAAAMAFLMIVITFILLLIISRISGGVLKYSKQRGVPVAPKEGVRFKVEGTRRIQKRKSLHPLYHVPCTLYPVAKLLASEFWLKTRCAAG
jgi:hypothetical protein